MASAGAGAAVSELPRRLDHAWRVFGTGLSFVAFGLGGLLLGVLVMPVLLLMRDPVARRRRARRVVQVAFASHLRLMRGLGVMTYEIEGGERLQRDGLLVLANHPTLIDVVCLISLLPNADCVVKRAVACNPFMRGPVRAAGYISNDDGAGLVDDCVAAVHAGGTLVIFPEGTRSVPGQPPRLQRGAANIAVRGRIDVTPVRITCSPPTLTKGQKWYRVPSRRFHVRLQIGEDIPIAPFLAEDDSPRGEPWRHAALPSTFLVISTCLESRPVQALEHEIKELIISSLSLEDITPEDIDPTAPLFVEGLGLDSIDALELGLALQKKYGVSLSADSEETRRHFSSVRALGEFVAARQS